MENDPNNANAPATKADLAEAVAATKGEFKELFNTQKEEMERLLADQANVILEAVDERMDKKLNEKFDPVMTKLERIGESQMSPDERTKAFTPAALRLAVQ